MLQVQQTQMESSQKLEFSISCRRLVDLDTFSKSDPFCILNIKKNNDWSEFGRTELIWDNLNPNFATSFIMDYYFEVQQRIKFEVHHYVSKTSSKIIGICETSVSAIAGAKDQIMFADLQHKGKVTGKLIVRADQVKTCNDEIKLTLGADNIINIGYCCWSGPKPFIRIYRLRKEDNNHILVFESEHTQNSRNVVWKQIDIKSQKLCNGDYSMPLKVELWNWRSNGSHTYLGECIFDVNEQQAKQNEIKELKNHGKQRIGTLIFRDFKLKIKPTFLDYIAGGIQLNLILAIDFTASNAHPHTPSSLHYQDPTGKPNQYQQAIISVGEILINYDYDKMVPVYGFGCKVRMHNLNSGGQTLQVFPINGDTENPEVEGLNGIIQGYKQVLPNVVFDGPTYFGPLLRETMKSASKCKEQASDNYYILLILTDGEIHDMQASIDAIIASSHLPLSIIIVGIGNADFTNMNRLDNDDLSLTDQKGNKAQRDLVQFVPFNEFKNSPELLAKNVLQELPDQLVDYMLLIDRKPKPPNLIQLDKLHMIRQNSIGVPERLQFMGQPGQVISQYPESNYAKQVQGEQRQQQYQQRIGNHAQILGHGMMRGGFLNQHIQQAESNIPQQTDEQHQQLLTHGQFDLNSKQLLSSKYDDQQ